MITPPILIFSTQGVTGAYATTTEAELRITRDDVGQIEVWDASGQQLQVDHPSYGTARISELEPPRKDPEALREMLLDGENALDHGETLEELVAFACARHAKAVPASVGDALFNALMISGMDQRVLEVIWRR